MSIPGDRLSVPTMTGEPARIERTETGVRVDIPPGSEFTQGQAQRFAQSVNVMSQGEGLGYRRQTGGGNYGRSGQQGGSSQY